VSGYLFDITALVEVLRAAPSRAFMRRLAEVATADRWTSSIAIGDLLYAARRAERSSVTTDVVKLIAAVRVAPFDVAAANTYGKLTSALLASGVNLSSSDLMNVSIARSLDLALVTRRPALFTQVPQLRVEDWTLS
jgi:tRNA(fMet)-specific endonuclease VapC